MPDATDAGSWSGSSSAAPTRRDIGPDGTTQFVGINIHWRGWLNAGDTVALTVFQDSGSNLTYNGWLAVSEVR